MLSLIIPAYNERDNIESLFHQIIEERAASAYKIIIVDDHSPDKTWRLIETSLS